MKLTRTTAATTLTALLLVGTLAGCSSDDTAGDSPDDTSSEGPSDDEDDEDEDDD